jgi:ABC-type amino acid transport substrate-binding protein
MGRRIHAPLHSHRLAQLAFGLCAALAGAPAHAQTSPASALDRVVQSGVLRVCTTGDYKPFSFLRADGAYEGMDIDLAPSLCAVHPDKPFQYGEKAILLPRDAAAFKAYVDTWLHLARASGEYERIESRWLR